MARIGSKEWLALAIGGMLIAALGVVRWSAPEDLDLSVESIDDKLPTEAAVPGLTREIRRPADTTASSLFPVASEINTEHIALSVLVQRGDIGESLPNQEVWHLPYSPGNKTDFEEFMKTWAVPLRSDADGILRIDIAFFKQAGFRGATFFARVGHLIGRLGIPSNEQENLHSKQYVLNLLPLPTLKIRALDHVGQAVLDVEISRSWITRQGTSTLTSMDAQPGKIIWSSLGRTSKEGGALYWNNLGFEIRELESRGLLVDGLHLRARVSGHEGVLREIRPLPTGEEAIALQLPPLGKLTVNIVDPLGRPALGSGTLMLRRILFDRDVYARRSTVFYRDGTAQVPAVALNQLFEISIREDRERTAKKDVLGPTDQELVAVRTLVLGQGMTLFRGRAVNSEGTAHAREFLLGYSRIGDENISSIFTTTGDDGEFLLALPSRLSGKTLDATKLTLLQKRLDANLTHLSPFRPGIIELGDLVFGPRGEEPAILSGRVIAAANAPCDNYRLQVEHRRDANDVWQALGSEISRREGSFRILGEPKLGEYRLLVLPNSRCHIPPDPIPFVPGQEGLEIRLERGHTLAVILRVPGSHLHLSNSQRPYYEILLRPVAGPALHRRPEDLREGIQRSGGFGEHNSEPEMYWNGLVQGTYRLEVRLAKADAPFRVIDGIQVPAPDGSLARAVLDLSQDLQEITLNFRSANGSALPPSIDARILIHGRILATYRWTAEMDASLMILPGAMDLWVLAAGYMPVHLRSLAADQDVLLIPSEVSLSAQLRNPPTLPKDVSLRIRLTSTSDHPPGWQIPEFVGMDWGGSDPMLALSKWLKSASARFGVDGRAELTVGRAGQQMISLELIPTSVAERQRWNDAAVELTDFSPKTFDLQPSTETQTLILHVTQAAIDATLRRARTK